MKPLHSINGELRSGDFRGIVADLKRLRQEQPRAGRWMRQSLKPFDPLRAAILRHRKNNQSVV